LRKIWANGIQGGLLGEGDDGEDEELLDGEWGLITVRTMRAIAGMMSSGMRR